MTTARALAGRALRALPEGLMLKAAPQRLGYRAADIPPPIAVEPAHPAVLIAPANSAGQGRLWARALDEYRGVNAVNLSVDRTGGYSFPSDFRVRDAVFAHSRRWSAAHISAVRDSITHVLVESERTVLGVRAGRDVRQEARALDEWGIHRAYVSHGSDLRDPDIHAQTSSWSPFRDSSWDLRPMLVEAAVRNRRFLEEQDPGRVLVATPDLLLDMPAATWLPNVVDPAAWALDEPPLTEGPVRVLHAPTNTHIKGSELIADAVERVRASGALHYELVSGVSPDAMPALYAQSDVVLDQFRIGIYSTTALEALAAGRVVLGFLLPEVRRLATQEAGMPVPIVQATPDTIEEVLIDIVERPGHYRQIAAAGPAFVRALHDGRYSAEILAERMLGDWTP